MNRLIHYTNEKFSLEPRDYDQHTRSWHTKPYGFWVSIEGENDWKDWCESEDFRVDHLAVSYEIELKENCNILHLKTCEDILNFTKTYPYLRSSLNDPDVAVYEIEWWKVKKEYQGIIISPYQWACRMELGTSWYYGWDCASGCIWDIGCIKEFKLLDDKCLSSSNLGYHNANA